jgi:hypothetical protein
MIGLELIHFRPQELAALTIFRDRNPTFRPLQVAQNIHLPSLMAAIASSSDNFHCEPSALIPPT